MPAILISIGGTGGEIVNEIRELVDVAVTTAGDSIAADQQRNEIRYFLVDTRSESFHAAFPSTSIFNIPRGGQKHNVDQRVQAMWEDGLDPFFRHWWPRTENGSPYLPGDYNEGAGQIRVKGKLAYHLHLTQPDGLPLHIAVENAVNDLMDARGPAAERETTLIQVYLFASLGGGTGSGMMLTVAQHLRKVLPPFCILTGVFVLASITQQAPHTADRPSIWANTDAALREIDYFQTYDDSRPITPFLKWPGQDNEISADRPPFHYCYLFGSKSRKNLTQKKFGSYVRLIAECIVSEIMDPLKSPIDSPHAQFVQQFKNQPSIYGRPTSYATASRADVIFAVDGIKRHLSRRFATRVVKDLLQKPTAESESWQAGITAADSFVAEHNLFWASGKKLEDLLRAADPGRPAAVGGARGDTKLGDPPRFDGRTWKTVHNDQAMSHVDARKRQIEQWRDNTAIPHLQRRVDDQLSKHCGPDGAIVAFVDGLLATEGGDGYVRAHAAIDRLRAILKAQAELVGVAIDGEPESAGEKRDVGLLAKLGVTQKEYESKRNALRDSYRWWKPGSDQKAKSRFLAWGNTWREQELRYQLATSGRMVYQELLTAVERLQQVFERYDDQFAWLATRMADEATHDLGTQSQGGPLKVGVFDHPKLVDYHFASELDNAFIVHGGRIAHGLLTGPHGVRIMLRDEQVRQQRGSDTPKPRFDSLRARLHAELLHETTQLFDPIVDRMTIWHALAAECELKRLIPEFADSSVKRAEETVRHRAMELDEQGVGVLHGDRDLLRVYIEHKIEICQNRARPFWQISEQKRRFGPPDLHLPYPIEVFAYDRAAYEQFRVEQEMPDFMSEVARRMQVRTTDLPGKHTLRLYAREGVVPLFFLDDSELREMRRAGMQAASSRPLYTDGRYLDEKTVPRTIGPGERRVDLIRYAMAAAVHFKIFAVDPNGSSNGRGPTRKIRFTTPAGEPDGDETPTVAYSDLTAWQRKIEKDSTLFARLQSRVDQHWAALDDIGRQRAMDDLIALAERLRDADGSDAQDLWPTDVDRDWWATTVPAIRLRSEQQRYKV